MIIIITIYINNNDDDDDDDDDDDNHSLSWTLCLQRHQHRVTHDKEWRREWRSVERKK